MNQTKEKILSQLSRMPGKVGFYYHGLLTGETYGFNEKAQFLSASIVKLPLMAAILLFRSRGETDFREKLLISDDQKVPGCGAVQHMTGDVALDVETLGKLMITISDNTASNALFCHYGARKIREAFLELGLTGTQFNRPFFDAEQAAKGIHNFFVPEEIGMLLEKLYHHTLIDEASSLWLEDVLRQQQINHKMGGYLPMDYPMAHKTGDDEDIAHDVGIVYAKRPFVVCFASNEIQLPMYEDFIRETTKALTEEADRS